MTPATLRATASQPSSLPTRAEREPRRATDRAARRRPRRASTSATSPSTTAAGIAQAASISRRWSVSSATAIAAGSEAAAMSPTTTEAGALPFAIALPLLVRAADCRRADRAADHAHERDQCEHVRQGREQVRGDVRLPLQRDRDRAREAEEEAGREGAERVPLAEDDRGEGDVAAAGAHVLVEGAGEADREVCPTEGREHPRHDHGDVPDAVDRDSDRVRCARVLSDGAEPEADRRPEDDDPRQDQQREHQPDHQAEVPEDLADERDALDEREVHGRDPVDVRRRSLRAVDVAEEVSGQPEREEVDREADDDLVGAQVDAEEGVDEGEGGSEEHRHQQTDLPGATPRGRPDPE